jgi:hypothetical protein
MSPRAACRLETLGFEQVYDYVAGKVDWLARGLPRRGIKASELRAIDLARIDAVTCALDERVGAVRERVARSAYGFSLVGSDGGVLLGRVGAAALEGDQTVAAGDVMEPGPSTIRAHVPATALGEHLHRQQLHTAIVTTPEGRLLGVASRRDLDHARLARIQT